MTVAGDICPGFDIPVLLVAPTFRDRAADPVHDGEHDEDADDDQQGYHAAHRLARPDRTSSTSAPQPTSRRRGYGQLKGR
jgi:hypothetical protein